jgi:hypothetical protein
MSYSEVQGSSLIDYLDIPDPEEFNRITAEIEKNEALSGDSERGAEARGNLIDLYERKAQLIEKGTLNELGKASLVKTVEVSYIKPKGYEIPVKHRTGVMTSYPRTSVATSVKSS